MLIFVISSKLIITSVVSDECKYKKLSSICPDINGLVQSKNTDQIKLLLPSVHATKPYY